MLFVTVQNHEQLPLFIYLDLERIDKDEIR